MANTITRNIIIPRLQAGASGTARDMDSDAQWTIHNQVGDWTIMATTQLTDGRTAVVIEDLTRDDGDIVYVVDGEPILTLSKTLEDTKVPDSGLYRGHTMEEATGPVDVLRNEILAEGHEPSYEEIKAIFPPHGAPRLLGRRDGSNPFTFLGMPNTVDNCPIFYGLEYGCRLNPLALSPEMKYATDHELMKMGLVGGWLPTVRISYPMDPVDLNGHKEGCWESIAFAGAHPRNIMQQPTFHRYLRLIDRKVTKALYFNSYLPYPKKSNCTAEQYYRELFDLKVFWDDFMRVRMHIDTPMPWLNDLVKHSLVMDAITRVGDHPRYGTVTKDYGGGEHDGFQDVFTASVEAASEWGNWDRARRIIDNYMTEFVRDDGSLDYRGPEFGQYARMITDLCQYAEYTGDYEIFSRYDHRIRAILGLLTERLDQARALPEDSLEHGLIHGRQEADTNFVTADVAVSNYDRPYWNNSAQAWRAFISLARVWRTLGNVEEADALEDSAAQLRRDLDASMEGSVLTDRDMPYLPMYAGCKKYHIDVPYRSSPESFDDNRVWTEYMGSGLANRKMIDLILDYEAAHQGSTLGIIGNRKHIVVFLAHGEGYGLLQQGMTNEWLMFYYGLLAHAFTRGTWSSFECIDLNRERGEDTPYVAAANLVIAPLTKWMLVFEDPADNKVWLFKGVPSDWLADGKHIAVDNAPTRFGEYSVRLDSHVADGHVDITLSRAVASARHDTEATFVRVPLPDGRRITDVTVNGQIWDDFNADEAWIRIPGHIDGTVNITANCQ